MTATAPVTTKLVVSSKQLRKALSFVGGAILSNPIVPILEDVLCVVKDGVMSLTGSDLNMTLTVEISIEATDSLRFCIPHKPFLSLISTLPDQPITIEIEENDALQYVSFTARIQTNSGRFELECDDPSAYPNPKISEGDQAIQLVFSDDDRTKFVEGVNQVAFAVAAPNANKEAYEGICWVDNDLMTFDGFRAARLTGLSQFIGSAQRVLPARVAGVISKLTDLADPSDNLNITLSSRNITCRIGSYCLQSSLREQPFPDYRKAIPVSQPQRAVLAKEDLISTIKRVLLLGNSVTNFIALESIQGAITVVAGDVDLKQQGKETLKGDIDEGIRIGVNGKFLLDCLQSLKSDQITLQFDGHAKAVMMSGDESDYITFLAPVELAVVLKSQGRK